jgi:ActR/RegA family two-component response regulator
VENPLADIDDIEQITDPAERARQAGQRLAAVPLWQERLRKIRQAAVVEMKAQNMSYADIGRELGLHRNRIQQILEGRSAGGKGGKAEAAE